MTNTNTQFGISCLSLIPFVLYQTEALRLSPFQHQSFKQHEDYVHSYSYRACRRDIRPRGGVLSLDDVLAYLPADAHRVLREILRYQRAYDARRNADPQRRENVRQRVRKPQLSENHDLRRRVGGHEILGKGLQLGKPAERVDAHRRRAGYRHNDYLCERASDGNVAADVARPVVDDRSQSHDRDRVERGYYRKSAGAPLAEYRSDHRDEVPQDTSCYQSAQRDRQGHFDLAADAVLVLRDYLAYSGGERKGYRVSTEPGMKRLSLPQHEYDHSEKKRKSHAGHHAQPFFRFL